MNGLRQSALALLVALALPAGAQVAILPVVITTVGELPVAPVDGRPYIVVDGLTASDCDRVSGGGGTHVHWCLYDADTGSYSAVAGGADTTCLDAGVACLFAGAASEGGPATSALDLSCTGCVAASEVAADVATQAELDAVAGAETDNQTAPEVPYTPTTGTDWTDPDPTEAGGALDALAGRLTAEEAKADDDVPEDDDLGTGTADSSTFLRGDRTWATPAGGASSAGTGLQVGDGAGNFSEVTGSSASGANLTLGGTLTMPGGSFANPSVQVGASAAGIFLESGVGLALSPGTGGYIRIYGKDGGVKWYMNPNTFNIENGSGAGGSATISFDTGSSTVPVYTYTSDFNTGLGYGGADDLRLISGGSSGLGVTTTAVTNFRAILRAAEPSASAPATCTIGDLYVDTSGAWCGCEATNTWGQLNAVGSCT